MGSDGNEEANDDDDPFDETASGRFLQLQRDTLHHQMPDPLLAAYVRVADKGNTSMDVQHFRGRLAAVEGWSLGTLRI